VLGRKSKIAQPKHDSGFYIGTKDLLGSDSNMQYSKLQSTSGKRKRTACSWKGWQYWKSWASKFNCSMDGQESKNNKSEIEQKSENTIKMVEMSTQTKEEEMAQLK
jgi:hypothetical protein